MKEFKKNKADLNQQRANRLQIRRIINLISNKKKHNLDLKKFLKIQELLKMKRNHFGRNFSKVIINRNKFKIMMMMLFCLKLWMFQMAKKLSMKYFMNKIIKWNSNCIKIMKI